MARKHKILYWDIETAMAIASIWRPDDQYVPMDRMVAEGFLLNWGAKWEGESKVYSGLLTPEEAIARDDSRIVADMADLIREADGLVAHNGDRFDFPILNGRIAKYGMEPLGPVRTIDTLTLSRKSLGLPYHKLDYLADYFGIGRKIKTDQDLWNRCVAGDQQALNAMKRYNRRDVILLEEVFEKLKPYVRNLPRLYDAERENERACPFCGSDALMVRGYYRTQASTMVKYQCTICERYSRAKSTERLKKLGVHPL